MTLGGSIFIRNSIALDYHIIESVKCLNDLCDEVVVVDAGSTDGTTRLVESLLEFKKVKILLLPPEEWDRQKGQQKLSYFTNVAINALNTDWNINLQADECIHEDCSDDIRQLIELNNEAYLCRRYNLWGDSQHYLSVPEDRMPVGEVILRLAKSKYQSVDDAQSLDAPANSDYIDKIRIYHTGFVRDKKKHMAKIEDMMCNTFGWGMDEKLKSMGGEFDPWVHFSKEDIVPIIEPLPMYIQEWANNRNIINDII